MFCEIVANADDDATSAFTPRLNDPSRLLMSASFEEAGGRAEARPPDYA
jgi:hypothetical protein